MSLQPIEVVVIDDDPDDFHLLKDLLGEVRGTNYNLAWISNSRQAVSAIEKQTADVYLIDYRLDDRTGLDILNELQDKGLSKPLILMTGQGDRSIDLAGMEKGAADFIPKAALTADCLERSIRYSVKRAQDKEKLKEMQNLKTQKESAEAANQMKSKFLAYMSHEIRTPLGAILGFTDLALNPKSGEEEKTQYLKIMKKNCEQLLLLINDFLDLSKIEAGKIETVSGRVDWRNILNDVVQLLKPKADAKGLSIRFSANGEMPALLETDGQRLRQIVSNLLGNAIKFTSFGQIYIHCDSTYNPESLKRDFVLSVQDSGIGISSEDQKKLFQPYQQANAQTQIKYGGTGLGLDLSRRLAQALGGELTLTESSVGRGSTFTLTLPGRFLEPTPPCEIPAPVSAKGELILANPFSNGVAPMRVLVADDSRQNQILMAVLLKRLNCDVTIACDGREAVRLAKGGGFDVIFMDIEMPDVGGYEATQILRIAGFMKPIVAITAHTLNSERDKALNSGFSAYLTKPIQMQNLTAVFSTLHNAGAITGAPAYYELSST